MSAFVVEDKTINIIVNFLEDESYRRDGVTYGMLNRLLGRNGYDLTQPEQDRRLAWDLFKMNCQAVNGRYGEGRAKDFRSLAFRFDPCIRDTFTLGFRDSLEIKSAKSSNAGACLPASRN